MRILHLNDYALPLGGAETYLAALICAQRQVGHEVGLMASDSRGGGTLASFPKESRPYEIPAYSAFGTTSSWQALRATRQMYNASALKCARTAAHGFAPDLVHTHMYLGQLSPAALEPFLTAGIPIIHTSHTYKVACPIGTRMLPDGRYCTFHVGVACIKNCSLVSLVHMKMREICYTAPQKAFKLVIAPGSTMAEVLRLEIRADRSGTKPRSRTTSHLIR